MIEIFGMKFESSSAGLLVFLIGAAFLATPLFVPERTRTAEPGRAATAVQAGGTSAPVADAATTVQQQARAGEQEPGPSDPVGQEAAAPAAPVTETAAAVPPRVRAEGREREPNEGYEKANRISVGESVSAFYDRETEDWFVMPIESSRDTLHIKLRSNSPNCIGTQMFAYNEGEVEVYDWDYLPAENTTSLVEIPLSGSSFIFLRFAGPGDCRFEFFTSYTGF